jgi:hypothetical protein
MVHGILMIIIFTVNKEMLKYLKLLFGYYVFISTFVE